MIKKKNKSKYKHAKNSLAFQNILLNQIRLTLPIL